MAARTRSTLPSDIDQVFQRGDLDEIRAALDRCRLDARGGASKNTALGFASCPPEILRELVAEGAAVDEPNLYGRTPLMEHLASWRGHPEVLLELGARTDARTTEGGTPLHAAARWHRADGIRLLVAAGADLAAVDRAGRTPLGTALATCRNADIARTAEVAEVLLAAGAAVDEGMRAEVARIGADFEFGRDRFAVEFLAETEAGLARLSALFGVAPAPRRVRHDGTARIVVTATRWQDQHEELWNLLVPASGAAATVQGEVIRISGRLGDELFRNAGANWDDDYRAMTAALLQHLAEGVAPLPDAELAEARTVAAPLLRGFPQPPDPTRLSELAVRWILANPDPVPLDPPAYRR